MTQTSNKYKPCKRCGCSACSRHSKRKQIAIKQGNRRFRRDGRHQLDGLDLNDNDMFEHKIISIGYTD